RLWAGERRIHRAKLQQGPLRRSQFRRQERTFPPFRSVFDDLFAAGDLRDRPLAEKKKIQDVVVLPGGLEDPIGRVADSAAILVGERRIGGLASQSEQATGVAD